MYGMTTLARCHVPVFLNVNSSQNVTSCSLKQSKRATSPSLIGVLITGDIEILDRVWTSVVACEHIVREK
jgi:hypothetical protein